ncbi:MAG: DNA repair protein RecO [Gammaproteobacteria bacterium]|nr:DNA repair protein RecO [Gammaproteobacteria bacterium]
MSTPRRVRHEPAWLLHHRPWSETGRILELLTRDYGRVTLFARGARGPAARLRGLLQPFVPLLVCWSGRADGGTLTGAESGGSPPALAPDRLMSGFYLNELLLRLLPREERHERICDGYGATLGALAGGPPAPALRRFELLLLAELGYGLELAHEAESGAALDPDRHYHFQPGRGLLAVRDAAPAATALGGRELLAVAAGVLDDAATLAAARHVLRAALGHCLDGRGLRSREVMLALSRLERNA